MSDFDAFNTVVTQSARSSLVVTGAEANQRLTPNVAVGNDVGIPEDDYDALFRAMFPGFEPFLEAAKLLQGINSTAA